MLLTAVVNLQSMVPRPLEMSPFASYSTQRLIEPSMGRTHGLNGGVFYILTHVLKGVSIGLSLHSKEEPRPSSFIHAGPRDSWKAVK